MAELRTTINEKNPEVVIVTEAFSKQSLYEPTLAEYQFAGYDLNWNYTGTRRRRGICIYTKEDLNATEIQVEDVSEEELWITFKTIHITWTVGGVYRSPNQSDEENNTTLLISC